MMKRIVRFSGVVLFCLTLPLVLTACGQKGALYLPEKNTTKTGDK